MDTARGIDDRIDDTAEDATDGSVSDVGLDIGADERRMHVRAYNHWVSLLDGRPYPSIENLDPESIADFGPHSVLLDFRNGIEDPAIRFLGRALREECGVDASITHIADVPARSLLSRLTDHYLQIIANRAPIGFEAEFVGQRGHNTLYRGILMPFSSDDDAIEYIYGVINWKELVDAETQARLTAELDAARRAAPAPAPAATVWADGPSGGFEPSAPAEETPEPEPGAKPVPAGIDDRLAIARETAAAVRASDVRGRATLYRALGRAHDFALAATAEPEAYARLLADHRIKAQPRAPMTPVAKLVFGADYDKTRLTEFAAVLTHAARIGLGEGMLAAFLDAQDGGIKGVVRAERDLRRTPRAKPSLDSLADRLRTRAAMAEVTIDDAGDAEFVVLIARQKLAGMFDIVGAVSDDALTARVMAQAAR